MENNNKSIEITGLSCDCGHCQEGKHISKEDNHKRYFLKRYFLDLIRLFSSILLFSIAFLMPDRVRLILFIFSAVIVGYNLIFDLIKKFIKLDFFNETILMLIASITSFILGEYFEGALILILYYTGEFLEHVATDNSKRKIAGLAKLKSNIVHLITKNGTNDVLPETVEVGSLIEVKTGEMVPIDGVLIGLPNDFDVKAITGESKYSTIENSGEVYSGAINVSNTVVIRTIKKYQDSTVEKIITMVEGSLINKAKSQKFISSFAKIYTPLVFGLAVFIAVIPPLIDQMNFIKWVYKALSFLVISCPCALVISVPLSLFVGVGGLAKIGVMVKGSVYLEKIATAKCIVFDKTGTITHGDFKLDKIVSYNYYTDSQVLDFAILLEEKSNHPIAKSLVSYKKCNSDLKVISVKEILGKGIFGIIEDKEVYLGNKKLMLELGIEVEDEFAGTVLYLAVDGVLSGKLYIIDSIKENARKNIEKLNELGVVETYILSGDTELIVNSVADKIGVNNRLSQLLPEQKVEKLNQIKDKHKNVVYVGDGINDSPSLALADVGVAMGALGNEIATSSADIVIMDDNLEKIPRCITHAKKVKRTVFQNIIGSLFFKFSIMIFSIIFSLPVWIAMFADVGVMLLAVCNSLRVGKVKKM